MTSPSIVFRSARVYSPADPLATAMLVRGDQIEWLGTGADAPTADRVLDLEGAVLTPAFVDAHVHTTNTGLALTGLDLSQVRSARQLVAAVATCAATLPADAVLLGHGWDESTWPDGARQPPQAAELDRAAGGRRVYLSQASMHSALCSSALLAGAPEVSAAPGYASDGWLRREAHLVVRGHALGSLSAAQRETAQHVALRHAASLGIAAVHECGGPGISSEADFVSLLARSGVGYGHPEVYGYWGELAAAAKARDLGAVGAGGDLFADGAFGSRTAHLSEPYLEGGCGHGYLTAGQVAEHLLDCAEHDLQGGFHAIGDAALSTVVAGFAKAADRLGVERVRAARHRVEHAELMDKRLIAAFVEYGVVASVQPAFDRLWGGPDQMYTQRLGAERALAANPLGAMHGVGVSLAFGSDSPVTPLDPWGAVRAAVRHHNPAQRMSARSSFAAHTRGGWRAARVAGHGVLAPGAPATFAVWDCPGGVTAGFPNLTAADPDRPVPELPRCRSTVLRGVPIFDRDDLLAG